MAEEWDKYIVEDKNVDEWEQYTVQSSKNKPENKTLPKLEKTEQKIQGREDLLTSLVNKKQKETLPLSLINLIPGVGQVKQGLEGAQLLGGLSQRGEAAIANPLLAFQKGQDSGSLLNELVKGVKGERLGELGDIIRTTGMGGRYNEVIAATAGFLGQMGTIDLVTKGLITKAAKSTVNFLKEIDYKSKMPRLMNDNWLIQRSEDVFNIADDTSKAVSNEVANMYKNIGNQERSLPKLQNIINDVFEKKGIKQEIAQAIDDVKLKDVADDISKELQGDNSATVYNIKKIKDTIQKYIPDTVWLRGEKGQKLTPNQSKLTSAYFKLKDLIFEGLNKSDAQELERINAKATRVYRISKVMKRMVMDETGKPQKTAQLLETFTGGAKQAGKRKLFDEYVNLNNAMSNVVKDMNKFNHRQIFKRKTLFAGGTIGALEGGRRILKSLINK